MIQREDTGTIIRYVVPENTRRTFEEWAQMVKDEVDGWEKPLPYCALHDFQNVNALTPALRHLALEVVNYSVGKAIPGIYVAVLFRPTISFKIGEFFLTRELNRIDDSIHFAAFTSEKQALAWLDEAIIL